MRFENGTVTVGWLDKLSMLARKEKSDFVFQE